MATLLLGADYNLLLFRTLGWFLCKPRGRQLLNATMFAPQSFSYNIAPSRVVFGSGKLRALPVEMARRGLRSPLILTTSEQIHQGEMVKATLGTGHTFAEATMHTPTSVTERALAYAKSVLADSIVSIGGGSTIGLGKAISIRTGLPHICIPTTYSGSEMTPILGESADGLKKTRSDPKILPGTVIYDVDLTITLPVGLSAASGMNAIAHAGIIAFFFFPPSTNTLRS